MRTRIWLNDVIISYYTVFIQVLYSFLSDFSSTWGCHGVAQAHKACPHCKEFDRGANDALIATELLRGLGLFSYDLGLYLDFRFSSDPGLCLGFLVILREILV